MLARIAAALVFTVMIFVAASASVAAFDAPSLPAVMILAGLAFLALAAALDMLKRVVQINA